ncbi:hypothetical protein A2690_03715 [Candidatus Roizmanbacteria bacterium RIFCSPHIGHO2_01_FULL_39_12b]|uniref:Type II secretion system protein GspG C-terminal domain-containing protein n=2 Tax=Candidatus Roizmaniibacteriota TaxID=1752723 RepID=A0A1F7JT61_9BACT|nr:MAG: hypothetical protein A2690_03715 [Candidatus Roizmanbacteria bacterium RIFCSPHIGHO2_01_FULL_39_12b]OGK58791.1 MAG: hypothetical protein A3I56_03475 [Candidatus Roizmanbacteria bacterium RIFCSPLOWO2_02_FULL_43_10]
MLKIFKKHAGFTLIELLIVIALLGALAVGLLAALDPFEQLKKGTDTGVRNTVSEFQGAVIRYYAIKNKMPWCNADDCSTLYDSFDLTGGSASTLDTLPTVISNITDTGELKVDFSTLAGAVTLGKISVFGTDADVKVCYEPTSKSFTEDPNTQFDPTTGIEGCTQDPATAGSECLWCVQ